MNILGPSTEEVQRQKFRDAVRRDINAVVGACLPTYIEFLSNVEEPKLVLGCPYYNGVEDVRGTTTSCNVLILGDGAPTLIRIDACIQLTSW